MSVGVRRLSDRPLLCLSGLDRTGGINTLLTAVGLLAEDLPRLRLDIVGTGPLEESLRARAEELGLDRVRFRGPLPPQRVRSAIHHCAAVVLPDHGDVSGATAGWHRHLQDVVELGRPLVTTDHAVPPAASAHIPHAVVVPPGDAVALAQALTEVLGSRTWRSSLLHRGPGRRPAPGRSRQRAARPGDAVPPPR